MVHALDIAAGTSSDLELVGRCNAGQSRAQLELFQNHKGRVHAILYRILGSNRDMEDLVQETFLEVFRSLPQFRGEARLGTWISCICSRVAFAYIARRKPTSVDIDATSELATDEQGSDEVASAREATRRLYVVLDKLDNHQRIAFALHVIDGRSMKEVATLTDASVVATKSRVWRARREVEKHAKRDPLLSSYLHAQETGP